MSDTLVAMLVGAGIAEAGLVVGMILAVWVFNKK